MHMDIVRAQREAVSVSKHVTATGRVAWPM